MILSSTLLSGCLGEAPPEDNSKIKQTKITVVKEGTGPKIEKGDLVYVLYEGHFEDGTVFDGNMDPGQSVFFFIADTQTVIKAWDQKLVGQREGAEIKLEVAHADGYGAAGQPPKIPPYADLYFDMKILYVLKKSEEHAFTKTDTKVGTGPEVKVGDTVTVHYVGKYLNDKEFDSSRKRGETVTFKVGAKQAIPGVDAGIVGMKAGGSRSIIMPPGLAFGSAGTEDVQGTQVVIFDIDLISVNGKK